MLPREEMRPIILLIESEKCICSAGDERAMVITLASFDTRGGGYCVEGSTESEGVCGEGIGGLSEEGSFD